MYWTKVISNWPGTWRNILCRPKIDPGRGGTHSANPKSTQDMAEHPLPTGNWPGTWRNTPYWPEIDQGRAGTHSADLKSTRDAAEHTLPTGNRPGTWRHRDDALHSPAWLYARDLQAQGKTFHFYKKFCISKFLFNRIGEIFLSRQKFIYKNIEIQNFL